MEYAGDDKINLAYMRHTGQWWEILQELTLDECIEEIKGLPFCSDSMWSEITFKYISSYRSESRGDPIRTRPE